ncbi:hypothetical protein CRG98_018836 [Punica granatum]|uniref:Uncharacterized protein n=1 Tax=Punica granatum TaxID=22663 RepID=A0A2I0JY58_PUNGR|nr:hypothetical protein CRG98_018836 [Punica granatum]
MEYRAQVTGEGGQWIEDPDGMGNYFLRNFKDLFTLTTPTFPEDLVGLIEPVITDEKNTLIISPLTQEEIIKALNSILNLKALGSDESPLYSTNITAA